MSYFTCKDITIPTDDRDSAESVAADVFYPGPGFCDTSTLEMAEWDGEPEMTEEQAWHSKRHGWF